LTAEEIEEKEALAEDGFPDWKRNHFLALIKLLEKHGRDNLSRVAAELPEHSEEDISKYLAVFLERYNEVKGVLRNSPTGELTHMQMAPNTTTESFKARRRSKSSATKLNSYTAKCALTRTQCRRSNSSTVRTRASNITRKKIAFFWFACTTTGLIARTAMN
jgi:hypothetical protein